MAPLTLTYCNFLLLFIILPIIIFVILIIKISNQIPKNDLKQDFSWILFIALIAFLWTPIWDNYLVANKIWWYDDNLVFTNLIIGYVPIEEYTFFIVQPILVGLYLKYNIIRSNAKATKTMDFIMDITTIPTIICIIMISIIWMISVLYFIYFASDYPSFTYLMLIIIWSFPPLMVQLIFDVSKYGTNIFFNYGKLLCFVIMSASIYLSLIDCIAIYYGIWTISDAHSIGNIIPSVLPFEEAFFFFITNVLCIFGCSFYLIPESRSRIQQILNLTPTKTE